MNYIVICADCNKKLAIISLNLNKKTNTTSIITLCPFCGSESLPLEINYKFTFAGINNDESNHPTMIDNIVYENNYWRLLVHERSTIR